VIAAFEARDDRDRRAQRMLIELVLAPADALWAFYEVDTAHTGDELVIRQKKPISVRPAARTYLRRAFLLQAEAGFDGPVPELTDLPP
jgi:hypothetical protein